MNKIFAVTFGLIVAQFCGLAMAQAALPSLAGEGVKLRLQLSPLTFHWGPRDPEDRNVFLIGVEREHPNGHIDGIAYFSNTFGQDSVYLFPFGAVYNGVFGVPKLSLKWTAGVIYGYKAPFDKKVPLNYKGFAPAIIPAVTYAFSPQWSGQLNLLGTQGVMLQFNVPMN